MTTDTQLLSQFQSVDRSLDSMRQAILTLFQQNLELLRIIGDLQRAQLQTKPHSVNPELEGLPIYLASFYSLNRGKQ